MPFISKLGGASMDRDPGQQRMVKVAPAVTLSLYADSQEEVKDQDR
jgi:hypothetical protein